jgi:hypothetical protein
MELTDDDKLLIARDALRGQLSDRYRIALLEGEESPRLEQYDRTIERLEAEVAALEEKTAA